jgi:CRP-like cAMP-binding protein
MSGNTRMHLAKGDILIHEGTSAPAIYVIVGGRAEVRKARPDGSQALLGFVEPGEVVGEMALIDNQPHMATVVACEQTEVAVMSRQEFLRQLEGTDLLVRGIVEAMARRLRSLALTVVGSDP